MLMIIARRLFVFLMFVASLLRADDVAHAVPISETKIVASDASPDDFFGLAADVDGRTGIIGAFGADEGPYGNAGAVYIFEKTSVNGWIETAKLLPNDPHSLAFFGSSVAITGDVAVVGAHGVEVDPNSPNNPASHGAAYIFKKTEEGVWVQTAQLLSSRRSWDDQFGASVDVDGPWVIVGSQRSDWLPSRPGSSGAAFIYNVDQTGRVFEVAELRPDDDDQHQWFGADVAISGDTAIVGEYAHHAGGLNAVGAVYIFDRGNDGQWSQVARLSSDVLRDEERFGIDVDIEGDRALVIATSGAFLFGVDDRGQWVQTAKIDYNEVGLHGAFSENLVVIGNPSANDLRGDVRVFQATQPTEWVETAQFSSSDVMRGDAFGRSVAIDGPHLLVGAPRGALVFADTGGAAYVFEIPEPASASLLLAAISIFAMCRVVIVDRQGSEKMRKKKASEIKREI